jgi:hypothetical protein
LVLRTDAPTAELRFRAHQSRSTHVGPLKSTNCQSVSNVYLNQSHRIAACIIQTNSATVTMGLLKITRTHRLSARHICTEVREWLWHSKCHNLGHRSWYSALAVSRWIIVDDLQAEAAPGPTRTSRSPYRHHAPHAQPAPQRTRALEATTRDHRTDNSAHRIRHPTLNPPTSHQLGRLPVHAQIKSTLARKWTNSWGPARRGTA